MWDLRHRAGFLGDDAYNYADPLISVKEEKEEEEKRGDTEDYLGYLVYLSEKAKEEGKVDELPLVPEGVDEDEAKRLAVKGSQEHHLPPPPQAPPRYTSAVIYATPLLEGVLSIM
jgi:hypothetical protein